MANLILTLMQINFNGKITFSSLSSELDTEAFMAFGEYNFEGEGNHTFFFEANYGKRETYSIAGAAQVFPWVPANNPYNLCNPDSVNYSDCWGSIEALHTDPAYISQYSLNQDIHLVILDSSIAKAMTIFMLHYFNDGVLPDMHDYYCGNIDANGDPVLSYAAVAYSLYFYGDISSYPFDSVGYEPGCYPSTFGESGSIDVQPIVAVKGDRTEVETDVSQIRLVLGMKGDVTFEGYEDWSYEVSAYRTESTGKSFRSGIRGDKLSLALGWDPSYGIGS